MRPVERGANTAAITDYTLEYANLANRIGRYCSYCEAPLKNGQVEHVLPQHHFPGQALSWGNLLLACLNCNATKGAWPAAGRAAAFWPDTDNTARAYEYRPCLAPRAWAPPALSAQEQAKANALLEQTGVDRHPNHPRWSAKDDRWDLRLQVWDEADDAANDLREGDTPQLRKRIAIEASKAGFWSVWRAVFAADPDMLQRINDAFVGTAPGCFDPTTSALRPRSGGDL